MRAQRILNIYHNLWTHLLHFCGLWAVNRRSLSHSRGPSTVDRGRFYLLLFQGLCVLLSSLVLFACEKDIDMKITAEPPVVVNCLAHPDSAWRVSVNKAWGIGELVYSS